MLIKIEDKALTLRDMDRNIKLHHGQFKSSLIASRQTNSQILTLLRQPTLLRGGRNDRRFC
jgi:hypothetical protein